MQRIRGLKKVRLAMSLIIPALVAGFSPLMFAWALYAAGSHHG